MTNQSSVACGSGSRVAHVAYQAGTVLALLLWALGSAHSARADTLLISPTELFSGQTAAGYQVNVPGPGSLFVSLSDIAYTSGVSADLTFFLTEGANVLESAIDTTASQTIFPALSIGSASTLYAYLGGNATGPSDTGLYSLDVVFRPNGDAPPSPVPLPPSIWLLLGGLAGIGGVLRFGKLRSSALTPWSA